jgi:hypothetical protein
MTYQMVWIYQDLISGGVYIILDMVPSMHAGIMCIRYDTLSSKILLLLSFSLLHLCYEINHANNR